MRNGVKKQVLLMGLLFLFLGGGDLCRGDSSWPPKGVGQRFEVTRDTSISSVGRERNGNNGGYWKLKLKGQQEYILFDIDASELKGKLITGAVLYLNTSVPGNHPVLRAGVSSVASPWKEGFLFRYLPQPGAACFSQALYKRVNWAYPGSSFMNVIFGLGHTIWKFADASRPGPEGWQSIAVDPDVVAARVAGISQGFCVADEVGSEWGWRENKFSYSLFPNRYVYSSEHFNKKPWMKIWTDGEDTIPPDPVRFMGYSTEGLLPGQAVVTWETPADRGGGKTLGFEVRYDHHGEIKEIPRYLIPMAGKAGEPVLMHIQDLELPPGERLKLLIQGVDNAGNTGEVVNAEIITASVGKKAPIKGNTPVSFDKALSVSRADSLKYTVNDLLDKINPVSGQMVSPQPKDYERENHLFSISENKIRLKSARNETVCFQVNFKAPIGLASIKFVFNDAPELEPEIFRVGYVNVTQNEKNYPLPDPLVPLASTGSGIQKNQSVICEVYVPHGIQAGKKHGNFFFNHGQEETILDVELEVLNFTLPDKLSFIPEMNAYGTADPYEGYEYYRLAHEHRTCLNRLPYGWNGNPDFAPKMRDGKFDWQKWDAKIGPLLDGSAFREMKRASEPVDVFYLPFNENWPVNIFEHFRPSYWADVAFSKVYEKKLGNGFQAFADHFYECKWFGTIFQFYLNNKIIYRGKNRGSSGPWHFDEPVNTQDFWALRWYGRLWKHSLVDYDSRLKMWFRADISYSEFARNTLWGITDVEYLGGNNEQKVRLIQDRKILNGPVCFSEYGSANKIESSNLHIPLWCLSAWFRGAMGVLPWQTMGNEKSWETADQNAMFYPHPEGPFPSIRLKAFMMGQQLVEYCTMASELYGMSRQDLKDMYDKMVGDNGGVIDPVLIWAFKNRIGKMISEKAPPYKRSWVNFRSGGREQRGLGYVKPSPAVQITGPDCNDF